MRARGREVWRRPWLWPVRLIGLLVPRRLRSEWRREWEAELRSREDSLSQWNHLNWRARFDLLRHGLGSFRDAIWLQTYRWEDEMIQDLRYGVRMLRKNPGFTAVAALSLALGIGANTAIFQLLDAVRLRALPVKDPEQLYEVRISDMTGARGNFGTWYPSVTNPIWEQIKERQEIFPGLFAWGAESFNLAPGGEVRAARILWVSGEFFNVLGLRPQLGRLISAADDRRGCGAPGAVLSHAFWQREYGGEANIVGRQLTLAERQVEIIGVAAAGFYGMEVGRSFDIALPICAEAVLRGQGHRLDSGTSWWLAVVGRLEPGISEQQATAHLQAISPGLFEATLPANYPPVSVKDYLGFKLEAAPAGAGVSLLRENYERSLWLLLLIAGLVLAIACANLANLLLARASVRAREIAIRQALGAARSRLMRQLLVESMLLTALGAALGVLLAQALSRLLVSYLGSEGDAIFLDLATDWRLLGFTSGLALLTCLLFGLVPALRATGSAPGAAMKAEGRATAGGEKFSLRRALVVIQVALSLLLLAGAFLFTRSLGKLLAVETGFREEGVLIAGVGFRRLGLPPERRVAFKEELLERLSAIAGVEAAAETDLVPISGNASGNNVWLDGADARKNTSRSRVSPGYFKLLGTRLIAGREFDRRDRAGAPRVAIVNEAFAKMLEIGDNPIGRRFWIEATPSDPETLYEIVGLVANTKYGELREAFGPILYLPLAQDPRPASGGQFLLRSSLPLSEVSAAVKRLLSEIGPAMTVSFQVFETQIEASILRERLLSTLSGFFGLLALVLACAGLYGLLSYSVAGRTREIGIRLALGAGRGDVVWLILREALLLAGIGIAVGLPAAVASTRLVESLLYGLRPADAVSFLLAALLLTGVAALSGYLPARRAARVDPVVALRYE